MSVAHYTKQLMHELETTGHCECAYIAIGEATARNRIYLAAKNLGVKVTTTSHNGKVFGEVVREVKPYPVREVADDLHHVEVTGLDRGFCSDIAIYSDLGEEPVINWAGLGNCSPDDAERYGRALIQAAEVARKLGDPS